MPHHNANILLRCFFRLSYDRKNESKYKEGIMAYISEQALVDQFTDCLGSSSSPWGEVSFAVEFSYLRGKTDIIAVSNDGCVIAFEAKLTRWRDALHQAYRNTCFAHRSYIVLPEKTAKKASLYPTDFTQRNVGLCYIDNGCVVIIQEAQPTVPIQPWLSQQATVATSGTQKHASPTNGISSPCHMQQQAL
jgi:hypothetical protein